MSPENLVEQREQDEAMKKERLRTNLKSNWEVTLGWMDGWQSKICLQLSVMFCLVSALSAYHDAFPTYPWGLDGHTRTPLELFKCSGSHVEDLYLSKNKPITADPVQPVGPL